MTEKAFGTNLALPKAFGLMESGSMFYRNLSFAFALLALMALLVSYRQLTTLPTTAMDSIPSGQGAPQPQIQSPLVIGIISRYAPSRIYREYQPLIDELSRKLRRPVTLQLSENYEAAVQQLRSGAVSAAFLGSFIYAKERLSGDLMPLAASSDEPGSAFTRVALICKESLPVKGIADLKGERLALPSTLSYSAHWFKHDLLPRQQMDGSDFAKIQHFAYHHTVIFQIRWGGYAGGVVRSAVAKEFEHKGIRILAYSDPFPGPPLVCLKSHDIADVAALQQALLEWHPDALQGVGPKAFLPIEDLDYERLSQCAVAPASLTP
jgi:phosphate/phosphite/phosphonate ABC transporter binding protein